MSPEIQHEVDQPENCWAESGQDLFDRAQSTLRRNDGFKAAAVDKFFDKQKGVGLDYKLGQIEFESNTAKYALTLERDVLSDRISLSTANEGVEEEIMIWVVYKEKENGTRGNVGKAAVSYRKIDKEGDILLYQVRNNAKTFSKIRQFLRQI